MGSAVCGWLSAFCSRVTQGANAHEPPEGSQQQVFRPVLNIRIVGRRDGGGSSHGEDDQGDHDS